MITCIHRCRDKYKQRALWHKMLRWLRPHEWVGKYSSKRNYKRNGKRTSKRNYKRTYKRNCKCNCKCNCKYNYKRNSKRNGSHPNPCAARLLHHIAE